MAVSVAITDTYGTTLMWSRFCDLMEQRAFSKHGGSRLPDGRDATDAEMDAELAKYGAWSDWDDWRDPLWFPDTNSLTAFLLTYG